jgi:hypothetical protein
MRLDVPHRHAATASQRVQLSRWFHLIAAGWIVTFMVLGETAPERYHLLLQEDRVVEWVTVGLFLAAGMAGIVRAVPSRRLFDGLVGVFCFVVAAEEVSWGQRLLGFYPPEFFLGNNFQQELNFHNLPQAFVQPKWFLMAFLAAYGILLPLLSLRDGPRRLMARLGTTAPSMELAPWFLGAIVLLAWYPLEFTGEWVEALAGGLFLASVLPERVPGLITVALAGGFGYGMTELGAALERGRDLDRVECATVETRALLDDITGMGGATPKLWQMRRVHKRVWSSIVEEYVDATHLPGFSSVECKEPWGESAQLRHKYGIDPWGSPYWLLAEIDDEQQLSVYSFGPNRRRDLSDDAIAESDTGDDVVATTVNRSQP